MSGQDFNVTASVNSNQNQKVVFKVGTFYNNQHNQELFKPTCIINYIN